MCEFKTCTLAVALLAASSVHAQQLGTISFPTSGAAAAQPKFIEGVKDLHSFEFDEAAEAFHEAQRLDPDFALAYWGEAHELQPSPLGATRSAGLQEGAGAAGAHASGPPGEGADGEGEGVSRSGGPALLLARRQAGQRQRLLQAMARMYERWPDDHEVAIFYALSLLGTVRPQDKGFRRQALAASIALKVFQENPSHPGAAHFIIHAFDDPDHAILALPAARVTPASRRRRRTPCICRRTSSYNSVCGRMRGASNIVAYKASVDLIQRMHLPEGREDFHTLSWLEYANLMLGKFDEARQNVDLARQAAERNPRNANIAKQYHTLLARYILETGEWEKIPLEDSPEPPRATSRCPA